MWRSGGELRHAVFSIYWQYFSQFRSESFGELGRVCVRAMPFQGETAGTRVQPMERTMKVIKSRKEKNEDKARDIAVDMLRQYWGLCNCFEGIRPEEWDQMKQSGKWGAALYRMENAIKRVLPEIDEEVAEVEALGRHHRING